MRPGVKQFFDKHPSLRAAGSYIAYPREAQACFFRPAKPETTGAALFTTQKCASTFVARALAHLGQAQGKTVYNFAGLYWGRGETDVYRAIARDAPKLFIQPNAIYGPLRRFVDLPGLERRPIVLILRDPRDVLVSLYHSVAFSHALPGGAAARANFQARRDAARQISIDDFARDAADALHGVYRSYAEELLDRPNLTFLSYEELISDPAEWSRRFIRGIGLEPDEPTALRLRDLYEAGKPGAGENRIDQHRRSGEAGQYRRFLNPETIENVERLFSSELLRFRCWNMADLPSRQGA
jgi:hypothetical protein